MQVYDVIIIGAGPAGLSAAIYAGRARLKTLLIEKGKDGGQIILTSEIENYPGSLEKESGRSLIKRMTEQAASFGVERAADTIVEVDFSNDVKVIKGKKGEYQGRSIIIASGAYPRPIGCANEKEFMGKGLSYCATCDAAFFEDMEVFVIGGGNSAVEEAIFLSTFARKVTIIQNLAELTADAIAIEQVKANEKIHYVYNSVVESLEGDGIVEAITIRNTETNETTRFDADEEDGLIGIFSFIGYLPQSKIFENIVEMERGYIKTDEKMATNVPGVYAAGDVRVKNVRQVVTASGDGCTAAVAIEKYLHH
ncbi:thioredoxin-disulfide reductase [Enterococcus malodoratus]|uniref:Thioredoxin reductase n=1 Tax=Enterococcus malodoratus ATCC 43197 TaxID=1158601 RepID=R2NV39_9ENTE|nr:thioredoxin-disulfide reductase [Enterococcus malodoratus]EOH75887.1 thioredoxin-disulfide reductase [Enterococcus malodoratus ATCC 43197]EOT66556.1 thioredoxin-disulfide reductase [Enterococcus malodoratus ATCC 43197]OJG60933.1 thioredoxin-disulfide reductase [Enterococcus malodoratus]SPW90578.1 thioredoxin-disulfide reductase [Enterococcus malodoratus]STD70191.1 thioredoxin-disulfide reductase [Enterococcus malodoratus]